MVSGSLRPTCDVQRPLGMPPGPGHSVEEGPTFRPNSLSVSAASTDAPRQAKQTLKKVKVGRFGNAMVPAEEARVYGLPTTEQETKRARRTVKGDREAANAACVGGLRSPWRAAKAQHFSAGVAAKVRAALERAVAEHPELLKAADGDKSFDPEAEAQVAGVERARALVAEALGVEHPQPLGRSKAWQPHLVRGWVEAARDLDVDLAQWLVDGAPLGVRAGITARGVFPAVTPAEANAGLEEIFATTEPRENYRSYVDAFEQVGPELARLRKAGYVEVLGDWAAVQRRFGRSVVVSKLAAILKPKADGTLKTRLVIDYRRSGVNQHVKTSERVVLPRIRDALDDAVFMMSMAGGNRNMSFAVLDFKDAFHTIPVAPEDLDLQVFMSEAGVFELFNTTVFGSKASPLIWGRFAAFLMRSGQSMFTPEELLLECYVDDPLALLAGDAATRRANLATLLLWWRVLGPGISWGKVAVGRRVDWIGATVELLDEDEDVVRASLVPEFAEGLKADVAAARDKPMCRVEELRRMAGKGSWAANIGPSMKNFLQPLWRVIGDTERVRSAPAGSTAAAKAARRRGKSADTFVPTRQVMTALDWLHAILSAEHRDVLGRTVNWRTELSEPSLLITCDASPWGLGAVLSTPEGFPLAWLSSPVSLTDVETLGLKYGESSGQTVLEALAILVALRAWARHWTTAKARVHVRSDSQAALGALSKMASPTPAVNLIAREVSVDVTRSDYGLEAISFGHVAGVLNEWADALSRLTAPEPKTVPAVLEAFPPEELKERDADWWRTSRGTRAIQRGLKRKPRARSSP